MNTLQKTAFIAILSVLSTGASAGMLHEQTVYTHRSQGEIRAVSGAVARLQKNDAGIFVSLDTTSLEPEHVYTLWMAVVNDPESCESSPCSVKDVLIRTDIVQADVGYADGAISDVNGNLQFAHFQPNGPLVQNWFGRGLTDNPAAEVHLIVQHHGPVVAGREAEMLGTYRGGCTDESIPGPMPQSARVQGKVGPYSCAMVQDIIFVEDAG